VTTENNDAAKFKKALCDAAEEMKGMMERVMGGEGKAKL